MTDWTCRRCRDGLRYDDERKRYVICDCPTGESKRRWMSQSPEERRREKKAASGKKKRRDEEPVPHLVKE